MRGNVFLFLVVLIVVLPLLIFELPVLIRTTPKWLLKIICFVPCGAVLSVAIRLLVDGNIAVAVGLSLLSLLCLYGGFSVKGLIE